MSLAFSSHTTLSPRESGSGTAIDALTAALRRFVDIRPTSKQAADGNRRRAAQEIARLPHILQRDVNPGIDLTHQNL